MSCCICRRPVTDGQDTVYLYTYPLVCMDNEYAHLWCFRIRISQAKNMVSGLEEEAHYLALKSCFEPATRQPPKDASCGYCREPIIEDEDSVHYKLCKHGHVHMKCASLVNFIRRTGCVYCYSASEDRRSLAAWLDAPERKSITVANPGQSSVSAPTKQEGVVEMFVDNSVRDILMTGQPCAALLLSYKYKLPYLREPTYPTLMRQLSFELNFSETGTDDRHLLRQEMGILPLMISHYNLSELARMGLTVPMIMYNPVSLLFFINKCLYDGGLPPNTWNFSFIQLLLAGVPLTSFHDKNYSVKDLYFIAFSVPAFLAAGGTRSLISNIISFASSSHTRTNILREFGYVDSMNKLIG